MAATTGYVSCVCLFNQHEYLSIIIIIIIMIPLYSYGREFAEPYLGHSIGPVSGYGVSFFYHSFIHLLKVLILILDK